MSFREKVAKFFSRSKLDEAVFEELADLLTEGDFGAALAFETVDKLEAACKKEKITELAGAKEKLKELLLEILAEAPEARVPTAPVLTARVPTAQVPDVNAAANSRLTIIMLLGVNGTGKTTSAAKLASLLSKQYGEKSCVLAAADTFRAAAIEQLAIHGERLGVRVVAHKSGSDPSAVVYDAVQSALASGASFVIADNAGRMHTKAQLVEELKKIDRSVVKALENSNSKSSGVNAGRTVDFIKYLVLDATTGSNALSQAEVFREAVKCDAVLLTKYDSGAKGGIVFALAKKLKLPIAYLCTGESYGDIVPFDAGAFADMFFKESSDAAT